VGKLFFFFFFFLPLEGKSCDGKCRCRLFFLLFTFPRSGSPLGRWTPSPLKTKKTGSFSYLLRTPLFPSPLRCGEHGEEVGEGCPFFPLSFSFAATGTGAKLRMAGEPFVLDGCVPSPLSSCLCHSNRSRRLFAVLFFFLLEWEEEQGVGGQRLHHARCLPPFSLFLFRPRVAGRCDSL